jgi:serine/threonine protein kinase/WD40 repeat protein
MDKCWQEIERIYHAAREQDASARAGFLVKACAGDEGLRREVESLLAQDEEVGSFLQSPAIEMTPASLLVDGSLPAPPSPGFEPGAMIAHYCVSGKLGEGGMGEVYRARDTKLQRDVALKILPESMAHDARRMVRFKREAQVLASLNHPNVAAIYGLEESNGIHALVMELVEGETLAGKIDRQIYGLAYQDTLPIARQIAEALEYAHERGVIHRDLKPANVKITPEGTVKVLDFGLAKVLTPQGSTGALDAANSPTLSAMATQPGMILGTAAYMSPEQAKGQRVDRRCDIWAFGCVLFEMLSGQKAFGGETISDVLAAVLTKDPDWTALLATTPPGTQKLIRRCLQKDAHQRLQAIGEARIAIEETMSGTGIPLVSNHGQDVHATLLSRALPWGIAGLGIAASLITLGILWRDSRSLQSVPMELSIALPTAHRLYTADGPAIVLSPDGSRIAYATWTPPHPQIFIRELDSSEVTSLEDAVGAAPFFSPDGQWVGFFSTAGKLEKVSVFGGAPVVLANAGGHRGGSWGKDGTIVFTPTATSSLYRISAMGGEPVAVTHLDGARNQVTHRWPQLLPGGKSVLFTASADNNNFEQATVEVASLATGQAEVLVRNAYFGRYLPSGYLTYISGGTLFAAPFDAKQLELRGPSLPVLQNIQSDLTDGSAQLSFSENGTAVYLTGQAVASLVTVVLVDRKGVATPLVKQPGDYFAPRFSPNGKQLALQAGLGNALVYDLARETLTPLTFSNPQCISPIWTPDGKRITCFRPNAGGVGPGISWLPSDGTGGMETLTRGARLRELPFSWSPDGRTLATARYSPTGDCCEIRTLQISSGGEIVEPKSLLEIRREGAGVSFQAPAFSPDGRWLAYTRLVSGLPQIFVQPYPGPGGKWQVSPGGGLFPVWSRSGHELYFTGPGTVVTLYAVPYSVRGDSFQPGTPTLLFDGNFANRVPFPFYDAAPDGKHFALLKPESGEPSAPTQPTVVLNWFARIERLYIEAKK